MDAADAVSNTLSRIFCQGGHQHIRMNATRLWGVMMHNCSTAFFERICSPVLLAIVKDVIDQHPEGHPLRDRLVDTIGEAVWSRCADNAPHPLAQLWRQVKSSRYMNEVSHSNYHHLGNHC